MLIPNHFRDTRNLSHYTRLILRFALKALQPSEWMRCLSRTIPRFTSSREEKTGEILYPLHQSINPIWHFYTETWSKVVCRWEHRAKLNNGRSLTVADRSETLECTGVRYRDSGIEVNVHPAGEEKWYYFYLSPSECIWRDFLWTFDVRRNSSFRELQFGFRYQDFYNRYRIRHEGDVLYLDKVVNGRFFNSLVRQTFVMQSGPSTSFRSVAEKK